MRGVMFATVELDAGTIIALLVGVSAIFVFLNKIADHFLIPVAKEWWSHRAEKKAEEARKRAEERGEKPEEKPPEKPEPDYACPMNEQRIQALDVFFSALAERDPVTGHFRWYSPHDWKERMDDVEASLAQLHVDLRDLTTTGRCDSRERRRFLDPWG
jgi:hypothetical protein